MLRQSVVHPSIIKEFLLRFPEYGTRLMLLMVRTALKEAISWKKRVNMPFFMILINSTSFHFYFSEYYLWYIEQFFQQKTS